MGSVASPLFRRFVQPDRSPLGILDHGNPADRRNRHRTEERLAAKARALGEGGVEVRHAHVVQPMARHIGHGFRHHPAEGVPEQFHNIGIRIEDDAIVTETGCELITRGVPVKADEIEALMRA